MVNRDLEVSLTSGIDTPFGKSSTSWVLFFESKAVLALDFKWDITPSRRVLGKGR
jgi:hypothetical protein